jgi:hypothetical protein
LRGAFDNLAGASESTPQAAKPQLMPDPSMQPADGGH